MLGTFVALASVTGRPLGDLRPAQPAQPNAAPEGPRWMSQPQDPFAEGPATSQPHGCVVHLMNASLVEFGSIARGRYAPPRGCPLLK